MTLGEQHELFKRKYGEDYLQMYQPDIVDWLISVVLFIVFSPFLVAMLIYRLIWGKFE